MLERSVVGASELAHLGSLLYVVRHVAPWLFVHRWLPCHHCLLLVWEKERRESHCSPGGCHRRLCVIGCNIACFLWEKSNGEGEGHLPGWMSTMTTTCVIIVWTWHVRWCATSFLTHTLSKRRALMGRWRVIATLLSLLGCAAVVMGGRMMIARGGGGGDTTEVVAVDDGGWEGKGFVCCWCVCDVPSKCCLRGSLLKTQWSLTWYIT